MELASSTDTHDITPLKGSARRASDGQLANLTRPMDYPVEARCLECDQPVRCERWAAFGGSRGAWVHLDKFSLDGE